MWLAMLISLLAPRFASGQDSAGAQRLLPDGLGVANQMKYSYDREKKIEIFEDWLNIDYRSGIFIAGLRFDTFEPNDPNPSINRGKTRYADIAFKYAGLVLGKPAEGVEVTLGNFYALFGRGMLLKSYEDRNIRIDNNLLGMKLVGRYAGITLTALTGRVENFTSQRTDILHAVDLEYRPGRFLKFGGTFCSSQPDAEGLARTRMASVRLQPSIWHFDFYGEYGIKQNDDIKEQIFSGSEDIAGRGLYASGNFYEGPVTLTAEYKYYDNFTFGNSDQTTNYNTPPATRRDYTHILLNRHPSPLNQNNEQGVQIEANYLMNEETTINVNYGLTRSLPSSSYYQRVIGTSNAVETQLREAYGNLSHKWTGNFATLVALGYSEERTTNTKNVTPIVEARLGLDELNSIHGALEHQHVTDRTTQERSYDDVLVLEYLRAPHLAFSFVGEMQTREPVAGVIARTYWMFFQCGFSIAEHTDGTILVGTRQAGNICIGGVCRYEPEFRGIELKVFSRF